ncbi:uncharacterized protein PHACADRAFT_149220 [Phanerochaete carnosa HHB-10118-sp]|uniref:RRM domain-containing protein n=1 Tax=Phanerochaete carnosa (strain HHB-10118-sp) TaxID=650164 RepID=K5VM45_PHACS|nr:uncharacterized protein PHACADRAFT_149220 [Phanerochaete carnosa HHB-10118-sp]EKM52513.1 hypothetical protein PHACADRAFT_149220 [Phanerochaete carnosa HHB-10118-sp]
MTERDITNMCSPYGKVDDVRIGACHATHTLRDYLIFVVHTSVGRVAAVTYSSADEAETLVDLHEKTPLMFDDVELEVKFGSVTRQKASSRTLFVSDVGADMEDTRQFLRDLFSPFGKIVGVRRAKETAAWFVDFTSVKDAAKVMDAHEAVPFRNGKLLLYLNYEQGSPKFEQPHHSLCITGFNGTITELEQFVPQRDGGNHVVNITCVPDSAGLKPPLFFIEFEAVEYATQALAHLRQSPEVSFSAKYAGRPNDQRVSAPRSLFSRSSEEFGRSRSSDTLRRTRKWSNSRPA